MLAIHGLSGGTTSRLCWFHLISCNFAGVAGRVLLIVNFNHWSLWPCDAGSMWLSCNTASATTLLSCILYLHHTWPSLEEVAAIEVMRLRHSSSKCSITVCGLSSVLCPSHKCCDYVLLATNRLLVAHVQCHYSSFQHYWVNGLSDKQAFHLRIGRILSLSYSSLRL